MAGSTLSPGTPFVTSYLNLRFQNLTRFRPGESKLLDTGVKILNADAPAIVCAVSSNDLATPLRPKMTVYRSRDAPELSVILRVVNVTDQARSVDEENPITVAIFALPITPVSLNSIHLFETTEVNSENTLRAAAREHDRPKVTVKNVGTVWVVRLSVTGLRWYRRTLPGTELGHGYLALLHVELRSVPLQFVDSVRQDMCSDQSTIILNADTVNGNNDMIRLHLQHASIAGPPKDLLMQFSVFAGHGTVIMRRNPEPYLVRQPGNGFVVLCPRTLRLGRYSHDTVVIRNAYSSLQEMTAVFFPDDIPELNITCGIWKPRSSLTITIEAVEPYEVRHMSRLGTICFFPTETFRLAPRREEDGFDVREDTSQLDMFVSLVEDEYEERFSDSDSSESWMNDQEPRRPESPRPNPGTGEGRTVDSGSDSDRAETPPILKMAAQQDLEERTEDRERNIRRHGDTSSVTSSATSSEGDETYVRWGTWNSVISGPERRTLICVTPLGHLSLIKCSAKNFALPQARQRDGEKDREDEDAGWESIVNIGMDGTWHATPQRSTSRISSSDRHRRIRTIRA